VKSFDTTNVTVRAYLLKEKKTELKQLNQYVILRENYKQQDLSEDISRAKTFNKQMFFSRKIVIKTSFMDENRKY